MPYAPANKIANLCDMFRTSADKIPPDLRRALDLLDLTSLVDLEERLLATTAFLAPWSAFRDSCLLVPSFQTCEPTDITRLDILWFYTQFDRGLRRHDPRTEQPGATFEIDKSKWKPGEHEKHLYAWLLQSFRVGKSYSQFGLRYLELRNICTAWEEVFVPIVKAMRASYSVKGRRYYGRLALFVEERCPSRLAFPEENVIMPSGVINSPTPFRIVSRPTRFHGTSQTLLTNKNYDEAERDLRDVYPHYGGLIERPRFKQKMEDWLEVQRVRAAHRKMIPQPEVVKYVTKYQPHVVQQGESKKSRSPTKSPSPEMCSCSPLKRYPDSIRRSLSINVGNSCVGKSELPSPRSPIRPTTPEVHKVPMIPYGMYPYVPRIPKKEPKSTLHGVTRHNFIPDEASGQEKQLSEDEDLVRKVLSDEDAWPLPATRRPRPELLKHRPSEQSVYAVGRNSNALNEVTPGVIIPTGNSENHVWSPMGAPSAIPPPLKKGSGIRDQSVPQTLLKASESHSEARHPSYEGNGYEEEIIWTDFHFSKVSAGSQMMSSVLIPPKPRSRIPAPINVPPPYVSLLRTESNDTHCNTTPSAAAALQTSGPPKPVVWPGLEESLPRPFHGAPAFAPPIPAKSPERWAARRGQRFDQLLSQQNISEDTSSHEMLRIVSKENIRAALGNLTPETSMEDLRAQAARMVPTGNANPSTLKAYNTHMFPRRNERSNKS